MARTAPADNRGHPLLPNPPGLREEPAALFPLSGRADAMTPRILLIDDDARLASMVAEYLGNSGFEVETAGSLAAGRAKIASGSYDALVLDLMLPDGDGLDLCKELRSESRTRHLPLLMLTARGEPMDRI